jgi:hypothetical protein
MTASQSVNGEISGRDGDDFKPSVGRISLGFSIHGKSRKKSE